VSRIALSATAIRSAFRYMPTPPLVSGKSWQTTSYGGEKQTRSYDGEKSPVRYF
jgi:hypothetical protein